jgi:hypothetical protein
LAVNLEDTTTINAGATPPQQISNWNLGDDRIFTGVCSGLDASDPNLANVYFTFKSAPTLPDDDCIFQIEITSADIPHGQITGDPLIDILLHVFSADYEDLVNSGQVYYWDFRGITVGGATVTIANGQVQFVQTVTQTNVAGTPAAFPNGGQPRFRGFLPMHPRLIPGFTGIFNKGDWYRTSLPSPGCEEGWVAIQAGYDSTIFRAQGIINNI